MTKFQFETTESGGSLSRAASTIAPADQARTIGEFAATPDAISLADVRRIAANSVTTQAMTSTGPLIAGGPRDAAFDWSAERIAKHVESWLLMIEEETER